MSRLMITPFNMLNTILEDFNMPGTIGAYPPINMFEDKKDLVVEVELSGYTPQDVEVQFVDGNLVLRGKKQQVEKHSDRRYFVREIVERSFERVIPLPYNVDEKKAQAQYKNGTLIIRLPKQVKKQTGNIIPIKIIK